MSIYGWQSNPIVRHGSSEPVLARVKIQAPCGTRYVPYLQWPCRQADVISIVSNRTEDFLGELTSNKAMPRSTKFHDTKIELGGRRREYRHYPITWSPCCNLERSDVPSSSRSDSIHHAVLGSTSMLKLLISQTENTHFGGSYSKAWRVLRVGVPHSIYRSPS